MDSVNKSRKSKLALPRPKNIHLKDAIKKIKGAALGLSPKVPSSNSSAVYSPVTDLAINLGETLQTGFGGSESLDTPKRRLSLMSDGSPSPQRQAKPHVENQLKLVLDGDENARHSASPDKPFPIPEKRSFLKSSAYQRFQSMRSPFSCDKSPGKSLQDCAPEEDSTAHFKSVSAHTATKHGLEDDDSSQDSGVSLEDHQMSEFCFVEPSKPPPRRLLRCVLGDETNSPVHQFTNTAPLTLSFSPSTPSTMSPVKLMQSSLLMSPAQDDGDDGFLELMDLEDDEVPLGSKLEGMDKLFSAPLLTQEQENTPSRYNKSCASPALNSPARNNRPKPLRRGLFRSPSTPGLKMDRPHTFSGRPRNCSFKRNQPCREDESAPPVQNKRRKSIIDPDSSASSPASSPYLYACRFQRSHSETAATIKSTLNFDSNQQDLVGDYSRSYCLPTIPGKHTDLKSITADTLADIINGEYSDVIADAKIIDCRYPYEYDGGHIKGALNIYRKDTMMQEFMAPGQAEKFQLSSSGKRKIIIFHCEFSSERGPGLARFLRNKDRDAHQENYPALDYPEIYLLHNGYKEFYARQQVCCEPQTYMPMSHPEFLDKLRHFRAKSKSWAGERSRTAMRCNLKL